MKTCETFHLLSRASQVAYDVSCIKSLALAECRAVAADATALLARCDQLVRLSNVPPGYACAVRDLANALRRRVPTLNGILTTQDT